MRPDGAMCAAILVGGFDLLLWAGAALVWHALNNMRASRPCRLGVGLVVATQLASSLSYFGNGGMPRLGWMWLIETVFYFMMLYLLYHMALLLSTCRR